jgi:FMN phosphatase YigB (HAD superfamily)
MCLPAAGRVSPFPGADALLAGLVQRSVRVVVVTNVVWRSAAAQYRDLQSFGLARQVAACVTSLDVGWRKPDRRFFDVALDAAGHPPATCAMVGDSEINDMVPASALGMWPIKVALEGESTSPSVADAVCQTLAGVARVIFDRIDRDR